MGFLEALDDDVLLTVLALLPASDVLTVAATAASWMLHLSGVRDAADGGVAEKLAAQRFSSEVARQAAEAASATVHGCVPRPGKDHHHLAARPGPHHDDRCSGHKELGFALAALAVLRALASSAPLAEAARRAFALRSSWTELQGLNVAASVGNDVKMFLDILFKAEVRRTKKGPGESTLAASDAALSALLCSNSSNVAVLRTTEQVVREMEQDLDDLVEERASDKFQRGYEVVARRRSAVEFLRVRMERVRSCSDRSEPQHQRQEAKESLDRAVRDLDETIAGYMREGYDLACPKLACVPVPHCHWWVCLGRPYSEGWVVLRSPVGLQQRPLAAH